MSIENAIVDSPTQATGIADDDRLLLQRYVSAGDKSAMGALMQRHADAAFRLARRFSRNDADAEDAVQAGFAEVLRHAAQFRGGAAVKSWMLGFVVNACRNDARSNRRRGTRDLIAAELRDPAPSAPDAELLSAVLTAVERLPAKYRAPVWLRFYEEMAPADVAAALNLPERTIRTQLSRGLDMLRESLGQAGLVTTSAALIGTFGKFTLPGAPVTLQQALQKLALDALPAASGAAAPAAAKTAALKFAAAGVLVATAALVCVLRIIPAATAAGIRTTQSNTSPGPAVLPPAAPGGRTLYVSNTNPNANDANSGLSPDAPFKTISRAVSKLSAGDAVYIGRGEYREAVLFSARGTAERPVLIRAMPGAEGQVILNGSDLLTNWKHEESGAWSIEWDHDLPSNYSLRRIKPVQDTQYTLRAELVLVDGTALQQVMTREKLERGTFFIDDTARRLLLILPDGSAPGSHHVESALRRSSLIAGTAENPAAWLTLEGLTIKDTASSADAGALQIYGQQCTVRNNSILRNAFNGMKLVGDHFRVEHNQFNDNGGAGIFAQVSDSEFSDNTTNGNCWRGGAEDAGLLLAGKTSTGNSIRRHTARGNEGAGIYVGHGCRNNRIEQSLVIDNVFGGLVFRACMENTAVNNIVAYTRALEGYKHKVATGAGVYLSCCEGITLLHNTLACNENYGVLITNNGHEDDRHMLKTRFSGNLVASNRAGGIFFWALAPETDIPDPLTDLFDGNVYFQPGTFIASRPSGGKGPIEMNLAEWRAFSKMETHSLAADPKFVNAQHCDFHLAPLSGAIGRCVLLPDVTTDFSGTKRGSSGSTDAGAFEAVR